MNEKSEKENTNNENKTAINTKYVKKQSELTDLELEKIKLFNEINKIIGISELSDQATIKFINEQKMTNISFIIDPEKDFNNKNNVNFRYEMIIEGDKLIDLKFDPTGKMLGFEYFSFLYYTVICFFVLGWGLFHCLKSLQHHYAFLKYYRDIYSGKILISKMSIE